MIKSQKSQKQLRKLRLFRDVNYLARFILTPLLYLDNYCVFLHFIHYQHCFKFFSCFSLLKKLQKLDLLQTAWIYKSMSKRLLTNLTFHTFLLTVMTFLTSNIFYIYSYFSFLSQEQYTLCWMI